VNLGSWLYDHAAKLIAGAVLAAALAFGAGAWNSEHRLVWFKAAELCVWGAGLFSVLLIRRQLWIQEQQAANTLDQLVKDHQWRSYQSFHQHFSHIPNEAVRQKLLQHMKNKGIMGCFKDRGHQIDSETFESIKEDEECMDVIRSALDCFEEFAGAVNAGLVDDSYAFSLQGSRTVRYRTAFDPVIRHMQQGSPTAYVELCKLAYRWSTAMNVDEIRSVEGMGIGSPKGAATLNGPS